ncbi:CRP-like cAMP-binding protein [Pedobacter sp. UYP24]
MTGLLQKNVAKHIHLSADEMSRFCKPFILKEIKKKQFLLKAGDICRFEAFVNKGCFKVFHTDANGTMNILYFAVEDWWIGDIDSFTNQLPAQLSIEALEDSEILLIGKKDKEALYADLPQVERLFRIMGQKTFVALQRRMLGALSKTADERYIEFLSKYPNIAGRLTNVQIAAYLGISHEFLSKIRKKIVQKK